jgi:site-specific DNA-methyltransferase (adenine-specific)
LSATVHHGDCRDVLATLPDATIDACVTDPPYGLGFMGKGWDRGVPGVEFWAEVFRVLKPGAHVLAFGGTRTYHRLVCAIEDAGFEVRDCIFWTYGTGFPKSLDVSKAIDKAAGAEREVVGFDAAAVAKQNKRPTNATQCPKNAPEFVGIITAPATPEAATWQGWGTALKPSVEPICVARKPLVGTVAANVMRFGTGALNIDATRVPTDENLNGGAYSGALRQREEYTSTDGDGATPLSRLNRGAGEYVQPLGRWPFAGSGTTGLAAMAEGFAATLIEADAGYADIIASRITRAKATPVQETMDL